MALLSRFRELMNPPDPALLEAGSGGERIVAKTRLIFWIFIGLAPLSAAIAGGAFTPLPVWISLGGVSLAIIVSIAILFAIRKNPRMEYVGYLTGAIDVTLISATLFTVSIAGEPSLAVRSEVAWAVYLLAIAATALRFDLGICLFVGAITIAQYSALILWVVVREGFILTPWDFLIQVSRIALMIAATAIAFGVIHRCRQLVLASGTDQLTGIANRGYFEERLNAELARTKRAKSSLSLVVFDLDHFKVFNDRYGHSAGDDALIYVTQVMNDAKRKQDFLARWGGEEFVLILPDTDIDGGVRSAERIRGALDAGGRTSEKEEGHLTVSAGVSQYPADGDHPEILFDAADRRMFEAKRRGRNRVVSTD